MEQERINSEIFYLVGALRDGCLSTEWTIVYIQKCKEWLTEVIIPKLNIVFDIKLTENKTRWQDGAWRIKFKSKRIWLGLDNLRKIVPKGKENQKSYIQGFWDAEGGCPIVPDENKAIYINFTQKDKQSLEDIKAILNEKFKIKTGNVRISDKKKNVWRVCIENQDGMVKFCDEIGSLHPEKKLRLEKIREIINLKNN